MGILLRRDSSGMGVGPPKVQVRMGGEAFIHQVSPLAVSPSKRSRHLQDPDFTRQTDTSDIADIRKTAAAAPTPIAHCAKSHDSRVIEGGSSGPTRDPDSASQGRHLKRISPSICWSTTTIMPEATRRLLYQLNSRWIYGKIVSSPVSCCLHLRLSSHARTVQRILALIARHL